MTEKLKKLFKGGYETLNRFLKYTGSSLVGTGVDTLVLWICSDFLFKGYGFVYILSPFISFECGNFVNFIIFSKYVWKDRTKGSSKSSIIKRFLAFNASFFGVFFLKMGLLLIIQKLFHIDVVICNLIALTIAGLINFFMSDKVIFKKKKTKA